MKNSANGRGMQYVAVMVTLGFTYSVHGGVLAAEPRANQAGKKLVTVGPNPKLLKAARQNAIRYLKTSQGDDGSWTTPRSPGISALVTSALMRSGVPPKKCATGLKKTLAEQ